jgi:hypothetical protein
MAFYWLLFEPSGDHFRDLAVRVLIPGVLVVISVLILQ